MPDIKITEAQGEDTQTKPVVASRERDNTQKALDGAFKAKHDAWVKAGKPDAVKAASNQEVTHRLTVAKTDVAVLKGMIRRAATFNKAGVTFYQDVKNGDGATTVKYVPQAAPAPKAKTS